MSFEDILEKTTEARNAKIDLKEHTDVLAKMLGIKINGIFEQHQREIMSLDKELRDRLFKAIRENFEKSITDVENYPKGMEL